jgi:hypothetical protein
MPLRDCPYANPAPVSHRNKRIKDECTCRKKGVVIMKAFLLACVAAVILAIIGVAVLNSIQEPANQAFATSAVRLGK